MSRRQLKVISIEADRKLNRLEGQIGAGGNNPLLPLTDEFYPKCKSATQEILVRNVDTFVLQRKPPLTGNVPIAE